MAMCIRRQAGAGYQPEFGMQHGGMFFPHVYAMQSGGGLFGALARFIIPAVRTVARSVAPIAKTVAKTAAKDLLAAGVSTGLEALEGHDPAESAKRNLKRAATHTLETSAKQFLLPSDTKKAKTSINMVNRRRKRRQRGNGSEATSKYAF